MQGENAWEMPGMYWVHSPDPYTYLLFLPSVHVCVCAACALTQRRRIGKREKKETFVPPPFLFYPV